MSCTHNAEQIKNKDDRGRRWIHSSSQPCFFEELHGSRTHLYNISTEQRKNGYVYVNSLLWYGGMIVMEHFASGVFLLRGSWISQRSREATAAWMQSDSCSVWLGGKWESLLILRVSSVCALIHTPVCMCIQACLRCFRRDGFQMMENEFATVFWIIFLGTWAHFLLWKLLHHQYKTHLDVKLQANIVQVHKVSLLFMVNEAAPSCISACHRRLESQFFGFLAHGGIYTLQTAWASFKVNS